ncbi:mitochondria fission 1 protein [Hyaloraphidium curvatum]|nr:mitochondria fission 1 protein [Hyaloraphidium curvatum]
MSSSYAIEAEVSLSPEELRTLRAQFEEELPNPSPSTKFSFAWGLIRSSRREDQESGVRMMYQVYKDEPSMTREALYYLALGEFKLANYSEARKYVDELLRSEPKNMQAQSLRELIDDRVKRDGLIGLGLVGGGVALGAILLGAVIRGARR